MDTNYLYQKIVEQIRGDILSGNLQPGQRLPSVRRLCKLWNCTPATVQRAYRELAKQGLIISHAGKGTRVVDAQHEPALPTSLAHLTSLRQATLVNRAEAFLLESISAGYTPEETRQALNLAFDHWQAVRPVLHSRTQSGASFWGSHDMAVNWIAAHFGEIAEGAQLQVNFSGSLGGLFALAEGKAEFAGCHLWDKETDTYNLPFVKRLLPGCQVVLVTLAQRSLGLIVAPGNPRRIQKLEHLLQPGLRFVNRQSGSGTRVWLDAQLATLNLNNADIAGYAQEKLTHTETARAVAEGKADAGLGLEAFAAAYTLDFIPLTLETYHLVFLPAALDLPPLRCLVEWLGSPAARAQIAAFRGYKTDHTGLTTFSST